MSSVGARSTAQRNARLLATTRATATASVCTIGSPAIDRRHAQQRAATHASSVSGARETVRRARRRTVGGLRRTQSSERLQCLCVETRALSSITAAAATTTATSNTTADGSSNTTEANEQLENRTCLLAARHADSAEQCVELGPWWKTHCRCSPVRAARFGVRRRGEQQIEARSAALMCSPDALEAQRATCDGHCIGATDHLRAETRVCTAHEAPVSARLRAAPPWPHLSGELSSSEQLAHRTVHARRGHGDAKTTRKPHWRSVHTATQPAAAASVQRCRAVDCRVRRLSDCGAAN